MIEPDIVPEEISRRKTLANQARVLITKCMQVEAADEDCLMASYRGFYLQISFSDVHPLIVFCLARALDDDAIGIMRKVNEMNLMGVFGSHSVNEDASCYTYRAVYWLDAILTTERWMEVLDRCTDEAVRGYSVLSK